MWSFVEAVLYGEEMLVLSEPLNACHFSVNNVSDQKNNAHTTLLLIQLFLFV